MKKQKDFDKAFFEIPVHLPENDVYKLEEKAFKSKLSGKKEENPADEECLGRSIDLY